MLLNKQFFYLPLINLTLLSLLMTSYLIIFNSSIIMEFYISGFDMLSVSMMIDLVSMIFVTTVLFISSMVMMYSVDYMKEENVNKFMLVMILFISFMIVLSLSANLLWLMIGWDGLGVTSFALIMYFQNWKSFNSAMVTFMCNRVGDLFILASIAWLISINLLISWSYNLPLMIQFMVMVTAMSKSAQVPFSSWLPLAMAAPTPVSSLVHSSTLVTAGVYMMIRFNSIMTNEVLMILMFISSSTVVLAGLSAMWEFDLKKIIALSTLSHIGLMMMLISIKDEWPAMLHLVTHSMFKSLLFMCAGSIIHMNSNIQDIRMMHLIDSNYIVMIVSVMSMMGMPFLSGFYSKEMMMLSMTSKNLSMYFIISYLVAVMMTCAYSMRILVFVMHGKPQPLLCINQEEMMMKTPMNMGCLMSSMIGGFIMWDLLTVGNFSSIMFFNSFMKECLLMFMLTGLYIGMYCTIINIGKLTELFSSMIYINSFCYFYQNFSFKSSFNLINLDIKGWTDYTISINSLNMLNDLKLSINSLINQPINLNGLSIKVCMIMLVLNLMIMMF